MENESIRGMLPYPPSINRYYTPGIIRTKCGKMVKPRLSHVQKYVEDCIYLLKVQKIKPILSDKIRISFFIYPPDNRRRDIDNVCKVLLDTLQRAGIYDDDFKIWSLIVERKEVRKKGSIEFYIRSIVEEMDATL